MILYDTYRRPVRRSIVAPPADKFPLGFGGGVEMNKVLRPMTMRIGKQENGLEFSPDDSLFKKLALPCESPAGLTELNKHLENEENFKIAVTEIFQIGGKDSYDFVRRAMSRIITNGLAAQYSCLGRRNKCSFYTSKVDKLVIEAALRLEKGDQKTIESNISAWLRRSTERLKFIQKRGTDDN
ncbi:unnamed protein product [Psylliodes chrysocephalus]|uniref:DUF4806 domain-containing protein n=1 Tax=Psylliodes chrysocephalus TaxID=3402493 RepID=A0A9P0CNR9_9CUCU|nr:unnamed protein product [Psylliodes chrysocephala]